MIMFFCAAPAQSRDQEFITELYQEFERLMFATVKKYVSDLTDQQDIVQSSIEKLMKKIPLLRSFPRCVLASYIIATIKSTAINHV